MHDWMTRTEHFGSSRPSFHCVVAACHTHTQQATGYFELHRPSTGAGGAAGGISLYQCLGVIAEDIEG
jgi:hypothetical protein